MNRLPNLALVALVALAIGCGTLYTATVTLTSVVDDAAKSYAVAYNRGLVPASVALQASEAHGRYRVAAGVARRVLEAVKSGQGGDERAALEAARVAANHFVDVLLPILPAPKAESLRAGIKEARRL